MGYCGFSKTAGSVVSPPGVLPTRRAHYPTGTLRRPEFTLTGGWVTNPPFCIPTRWANLLFREIRKYYESPQTGCWGIPLPVVAPTTWAVIPEGMVAHSPVDLPDRRKHYSTGSLVGIMNPGEMTAE